VIDTLLVLAKQPMPGRVKTRLVPPLTHRQAADLARAALEDTLRVASSVPARRWLLALDGTPDRGLPTGWCCVAQHSGGLDRRLAGAFEHARGPAILIGMDTPHLQCRQLAEFDPARYDACLGPAVDGGYWAIGFADPRVAAVVVPGVPMSTARTGREQLRRLRACGLRVQLLDTLDDIDTFDTAQQVAADYPHGAFARAVRELEQVAE
jgi:glycosyltransferase A (GT-A) superfamily protein (DUF2064 family)